ncbi:MAG: phage tail tape measure protein [Sporolactobacillus sp.]
MGVVRKLTTRMEFVVNYSPLQRARQETDEAVRAQKALGQQSQVTGQTASRMGEQFRSSTDKIKGNTDALKSNSQETASASDRVKGLNRQLELSKSSLKASTAGLDDLGRKTAYARIKASGLTEVYELQRQKVAALREKYRDMNSATVASASAMHKMRVQINEENAELGKLQGKLAVVNQEARHTRKTFITMMDGAGSFGANYLMTVSAPIAYGLTKATKSALDFNQEMQLIRNEVDGSGMSAKRVNRIMNQIGSDSKKWSGEFGKSTSEVNEGMLDIIRDGYSAKEVVGTLPTDLAAARGSAEGLKTVTVATTGTLEQFGEKSKNAGETIRDNNKITNGFMKVANLTKATIGDLGESFSIMGATASANHQKIADFAGAVGELRSRGIDASAAGTALKSGMVNMVKPTKQMAAAMRDMNLHVIDAKGNMKSLPDILGQIQKGTDHMTSSHRNMDIAALMGKENLSVWQAMIEAGVGHLEHLSKAYSDAGNSAQKMSDKMNKTPLSKLQQFESSVHNLGIDFGNEVLPTLKPVVGFLTKAVHGFDGLSSGMKKAAVYGGIFAAAGVPLLVTLGRAYGWLIRLQDHLKMGQIYKTYRNNMIENAAATETFAEAENSAANSGSGSGGGIGGVSGRSSGKKGGLIKRLFKRGGAASGAETVAKDAATIGENATPVVEGVSKSGRLLSTAGKLIGGATVVGDVATSATGLIGMTKKTAGEHIGNAAGSLGGTVIGGAIGTAIAPGIGTAVGAALGSWLGSKGGELLGKAVQHSSEQAAKHSPKKLTAGDATLMNDGLYDTPTAVKKADPAKKLSASAKDLIKNYNSARGAIDNTLKSIAVTGGAYSAKAAKSVDNAYKSIVKDANSAAKSQEGATKSHLNSLVKDGLMSASTAAKDERVQKKQYKTNISLASNASKQLIKLNDSYHTKVKASENKEGSAVSAIRKKYTDKYGNISATGEKKVSAVEQKYENQRRSIAASYGSKRVALEKALKSDVAGVLSKSASQQKIILGKLRDDSGKLSSQQASKIVQQAKKARDGAASAANSKYKKVMAAADQEYYVTGSISKKQFESIKKKAENQRDSAVSAANDQWHDTVKAAKNQAGGQGKWMDWTTGKELGFWGKVEKVSADALNWLTKLFTGKSGSAKAPSGSSKAVAYTQSTVAHGMTYATGTAAGGHPGGNAILGDGGKPELWITPQGKAGISPAVPTMYQDMPRGTQVLNGNDTERALGMRAYAKGTSGFWSSVGDYLGKGFNWIKGGASTAANYVMKKFGVGNVGNIGDLTQFTKDTAMPAVKKLLGSAISKVAHSSGAAAMGDIKGVNLPGSAKAWIAKGMKLAGVSGANWAKGLAIIAQHESGGNQSAVNRTDSNAKAGHPSAGLMQMIQSTFAAHAVKGHTTWMNPIDQVASAVGYIKSRYGGINGVPGIASMAKGGKYVGYAKGTKGAGAWAAKLFGGSKKKDDSQDKSSNLAISQNKATSINPVFNITINVNGNDKGMSENKIARLAREQIEEMFGNMRQTFDTGVEY